MCISKEYKLVSGHQEYRLYVGKGPYAVRKYIPVWICTHPTNEYEVCYLNIELAGKSFIMP